MYNRKLFKYNLRNMNENKKDLKSLKQIERNIPNSVYFRTHKNWTTIFNQQIKLNKKNLDNFLEQNKRVSFGIGMTENEQIKHNLLMNIKTTNI